ncbi:MAG: hypothetical protein ACODAU_13880 [Myxococcota bacterium]
MSRDRFVEVMREAILSLPQDMKAVLRIVEDPDIEDDGRIDAAGALLHVLSASNAIPGARGILQYVDDAVVLRLVLEKIERRYPDALAHHREESPELFDPLEEDLQAIRAYLGDSVVVLERAAEAVSKLSHQGHTARQCALDPDAGNWLYDAVQEAIVEELELDEEEVTRETKHMSDLVKQLETRARSLK